MLPNIDILSFDKVRYALVDGDDLITQSIKKSGVWAKKEQLICEAFVVGLRNFSILDIGANLGAFSVPIAQKISSSGGKIYSFEPQRIVFQQLCANLFINQIDNAFVYNKALGSFSGELELPEIDYEKSNNIGGFSVDDTIRTLIGDEAEQGRTGTKNSYKDIFYSVSVCKLDQISIDAPIAFIKLDVEGYELEVLMGARTTLDKHQYPPVLFEVWGDKFSWSAKMAEDLFNFFESLGYQITNVGGREFLAQHPSHSRHLRFSIEDGIQIANLYAK